MLSTIVDLRLLMCTCCTDSLSCSMFYKKSRSRSEWGLGYDCTQRDTPASRCVSPRAACLLHSTLIRDRVSIIAAAPAVSSQTPRRQLRGDDPQPPQQTLICAATVRYGVPSVILEAIRRTGSNGGIRRPFARFKCNNKY